MRITLVCASVLGLLAGSYNSAWADYGYAQQFVTFTAVTSTGGAQIVLLPDWTSTLADSASAQGFRSDSHSSTFTVREGTEFDIQQAFTGNVSPFPPPPENTFTPSIAGSRGLYGRADIQTSAPVQSLGPSGIPIGFTTSGNRLEPGEKLVAEANINLPAGLSTGRAVWDEKIPFSITGASTPLILEAEVPSNSSGQGQILTTIGAASRASVSFSATLGDAAGNPIPISGSPAWTPDQLNEVITGSANASFAGTVSTFTPTLAPGSYTLTLHETTFVSVVPEPASIVLGAMGFIGVLGSYAWRYRRLTLA